MNKRAKCGSVMAAGGAKAAKYWHHPLVRNPCHPKISKPSIHGRSSHRAQNPIQITPQANQSRSSPRLQFISRPAPLAFSLSVCHSPPMPKRVKPGQRPTDINQIAHQLVEQSTFEPEIIPETIPQSPTSISQYMAAICKKGGKIGGKWTWPGREKGRRCVSRSLVPGFRYRPRLSAESAARHAMMPELSFATLPVRPTKVLMREVRVVQSPGLRDTQPLIWQSSSS